MFFSDRGHFKMFRGQLNGRSERPDWTMRFCHSPLPSFPDGQLELISEKQFDHICDILTAEGADISDIRKPPKISGTFFTNGWAVELSRPGYMKWIGNWSDPTLSKVHRVSERWKNEWLVRSEAEHDGNLEETDTFVADDNDSSRTLLIPGSSEIHIFSSVILNLFELTQFTRPI
ncbi:hypothetical protein T439DRAFT_105640 [Meredithblackwellia eburnea MCA 4105]